MLLYANGETRHFLLIMYFTLEPNFWSDVAYQLCGYIPLLEKIHVNQLILDWFNSCWVTFTLENSVFLHENCSCRFAQMVETWWNMSCPANRFPFWDGQTWINNRGKIAPKTPLSCTNPGFIAKRNDGSPSSWHIPDILYPPVNSQLAIENWWIWPI